MSIFHFVETFTLLLLNVYTIFCILWVHPPKTSICQRDRWQSGLPAVAFWMPLALWQQLCPHAAIKVGGHARGMGFGIEGRANTLAPCAKVRRLAMCDAAFQRLWGQAGSHFGHGLPASLSALLLLLRRVFQRLQIRSTGAQSPHPMSVSCTTT